MFLDVVEFIYNNFLIMSVIVGSAGFFILFIKQWYEEREMNRMLSQKKTMLRNLRDAARRRPSLTRTLIIGVPLLFLAGFLYLSFRPPMDYTHHIKRLEDGESFSEVRTAFNEKFYSSPLQSSSEMEDMEALRRIENKKADDFKGIDHVLKTEDRLYVTTSHGIEVIKMVDGALTEESTLLFPTSECEGSDFSSQGIFSIDDKLVVIAQVSEGPCDDGIPGLLELERKTVVRVHDTDDDHELIDTYEFDGVLSNAMFDGDMLYMSVNDYIAMGDSGESPEDYLPSMSLNGSLSTPDFSEVRYLDNTNPNNFMAIYAVDVNERSFDYEMTLTDYRHHLDFVGDSVYMTTNSYEFESSSTMFQLPDPIQSVDTIVSKFSLVSERVHYSRTKKLNGSISGKNSLSFSEDTLFLVSEDKDRTTQKIYRLDRQLNEKAAMELDHHDPVGMVLDHGDYLYLFSPEGERETRIFEARENEDIVYFDDHSGLGFIEHYEENALFDLLLGFDKDGDSLVMTMYETGEDGILNPTRRKIIEYDSMGLALKDSYPFENVMYAKNRNLLIVPLFNGVEDPLGTPESRLLKVYSIYPNIWFAPETDLSLTHDDHFDSPYSYRFVLDTDYAYHITPGGVVLTESDNPSSVIQRLNFYD